VSITARNDMVLVRIVDKGRTESGIAMPDMAQEGKEYIVESIGPKVEGLDIGDKVLVLGARGSTWEFIPNSRDLFIVRESAIPLVYGGTAKRSGAKT
jgi:hypothetical protein